MLDLRIDEYIKDNFLELNSSHWNDKMILDYAVFLKVNFSEYQEIMDEIDFDDLHDSIADDEQFYINYQVKVARSQIIHAFNKNITERVQAMQDKIEELEDMTQLERYLHDRAEANAINSDNL